MKRHGQIMARACTWDNAHEAFHLAAAGKRRRAEVTTYADRLDENLALLLHQLMAGRWRPSPYRRFIVRDPKLRVIHAAAFPDRVAHHLLMRVAGPLLDRSALPHSHACRVGKGNLSAVLQAADHTRRRRFFLKLDVRRYFDSIPHATLERLLRGKFKDGAFLEVLSRIIGTYSVSPGRGLPIGTLASQHFANFYLGGIDQEIVERLPCPAYLRYMDDLVLWHDDPAFLQRALDHLHGWLAEERGLEFKGRPRIRECREGVEFLGYRITPRGILLGRRARRRFRSRLRQAEQQHDRGQMTCNGLQRRADALLAFTAVARCRDWRRRVLMTPALEFRGPQAPTASCAAARGTTTPRTAAPPSATGTSLPTATGTWVFACPQLTRVAAAARLTRSPELPRRSRQDTRSPGAGREVGRPQPNAPGDQPDHHPDHHPHPQPE